jgi:GNAT superfamily N-acetyltransferase
LPNDSHGASALNFREATVQDCEQLATFNRQLIRDEGHRNPMSLEELGARMSGWLSAGEYRAVVFEAAARPCGYALFRRDSDSAYLRHFFVAQEFRRRGIGTAALEWLWRNAWPDATKLRIDVLVGNSAAHAFWKAVGFQDYCVTMEAERARGGRG